MEHRKIPRREEVSRKTELGICSLTSKVERQQPWSSPPVWQPRGEGVLSLVCAVIWKEVLFLNFQ